MSSFARTDTSIIGHWWWTVDRWILGAVFLLIVAGALLSLAASPAVAGRIYDDNYFFVKKHMLLMPVAVIIMLAVSMASLRAVRRIALVVLLLSLVAMVLTLLIGAEINGARRWLSIAGLSLQPSEFLKPSLIVTAGWLFAGQKRANGVPGNWIAIGLLILSAGLLAKQPDIGQAALLTVTICAMFFIAGMPWVWIGVLSAIAALGGALAYRLLPHVTIRIDDFFNAASGKRFQPDTAINAFIQGGPLGRGPGEGTLKRILPDAHTDYIFAVAGEEFGIIACLLLVALFAFVVLRGLARAFTAEEHFVQLAGSGLIFLFGLQAVINMGVNLDLLPAKGMTLPFISYGGSSFLALGLTLGMLLALLRKRAGVSIGGATVGRAP